MTQQVAVRRRSSTFVMKLVGAESPLEVNRAIWGYIFLLPWALGLLIFTLGPIIASAYYSLNEYDVISAPKWIGLQNYNQAFFGDKLFWPSLGRTFNYAVVVVPLGLAGSLALALLLNSKAIKGTNVFRTFFFLPSLTPIVALALLWAWLLHPSVGPVNYALSLVGIPGPRLAHQQAVGFAGPHPHQPVGRLGWQSYADLLGGLAGRPSIAV